VECVSPRAFSFYLNLDSDEESVLLTEAEVQRSFRQLVKRLSTEPEALDRAEEVLDELRPESPLRHRLSSELEELRKLAGSQA
jgi:hypothetical protein